MIDWKEARLKVSAVEAFLRAASRDDGEIMAPFGDLDSYRVMHLSREFVNIAMKDFPHGQPYDPKTDGYIDLPFPRMIIDCDDVLLSLADDDGKHTEAIVALIVEETAPGWYRLLAWTAKAADPNLIRFLYHDPHFESSRLMHCLPFWLCKKLKEKGSAFAIERANRKFKYGSKGDRHFLKVSSLVRVTTVEARQNLRPVMGGSVDWSICWEVRGHWRRIAGVGRDRSGVYNVRGATWINPFLKGNRATAPIHQLRMVKPPQHRSTGANA